MDGNGSPQLENGYLRIANELWEALMKFPMTDYDRRVLMAVMRKIYGFNKTQDSVSLSQICVMTKIDRSNVCKSLKRLVANGPLRRIATTPTSIYSINKYYLTWQWRNSVVADLPLGSGDPANGVVADPPHTKDILTKDIKDNTPFIPLKGENKKRRFQLDENFKVREEHREWAKQKDMPNPDDHIDAFIDYHLAKGSMMKNWDRAFYTWLRNARKFEKQEPVAMGELAFKKRIRELKEKENAIN